MLPSTDLAEYAARRRAAAGVLRQKSWVAFLVERVFRGLQRCSPASRLHGTETDWYLLAWLAAAALLGLLSYCWYPELPPCLKLVLLAAAALRVGDITQLLVNVALFDRLGYPRETSDTVQGVQDPTRSVVLLLGNFFELMLWFGLAYVPLAFLQGMGSFWSRFYFSAVTQLTIGYGDLTPLGWGKAIAVAQGTLGWVLTVIVIARFVGSLPRIQGPKPA